MSAIDVWVAWLDELAPYQAKALVATCAATERARASRLPRPDQQRRWLLARGVLRALLASPLGVAPARIRLRPGADGKLALPPHAEDVRFNLSHSGGLAVYVLAQGQDVGVDVEACDPVLDIEAIARRCFAPAETARLLTLPAPARRAAFFRSWCRKEAVLKARGTGLRDGLAAVVIPSPQTDLAAPTAVPGLTPWTVADLDVAAGHAAAIAAQGGDWHPLVRRWSPGIPGPARASYERSRPALIDHSPMEA